MIKRLKIQSVGIISVLLLAVGLLLLPDNPALADGPITRIVAESISLDAPVAAMGWETVTQDGVTHRLWRLPLDKAGWHEDSKLPGQGGNVVISGRNSQHAQLFRNLNDLAEGDLITLYAAGVSHSYRVAKKLLLKDKGEPLDVRRENARWIGPINEERLTLASNWPYETATHKIVIVAWPVPDTLSSPTLSPTVTTDPTLPVETEAAETDNVQQLPRTEVQPSSLPSLADEPLLAEVETPTDASTNDGADTTAADNLPALSRLVIPAIGLNTAVIDIGLQQVEQNGVLKKVWQVADFAAGWHKTSKKPGQNGNIVLSGHHNINGQVFRYLVDLTEGDVVTVYQGNTPNYYEIVEKVIVKEKGEPLEVRRENAKWIGPMAEERLTLVTCWPYNSNTHRLIVVAKPTAAPAQPLALDPMHIEQRNAAIALDTMPQPQGPTFNSTFNNEAAPAAVFSGGSTNTMSTAPLLTRLVAPSINLDARVVKEGWKVVERNDRLVKVWDIPHHAAGWHTDSRLPGQGGNVVLSGYHNAYGEVFRYLVDLKAGDPLTLFAGDQTYRYEVVDKLILKDKGEPEAVRRENARWIGQISEERLTLVTGWPYDSNTHRVVVVAHPRSEF